MDIVKLRKNLKGIPVPQLLFDFYEYYASTSSPFIDIEVSEEGDRDIGELLHESVRQDFALILKHSSDSLICFWLISGSLKPLVWLDSEGSPSSIFADSIQDLFSLLCYDTGFICDALLRCEVRGVFEEQVIPDDLEYTSDQLDEYLRNAADYYEGYNEFRLWLSRYGISPMESPCKKIASTLLKYPNLNQWLEERGM